MGKDEEERLRIKD